MSGPSLDLEKPNAIGGLDRLVTNFALSVIAVIPTFFTCIFMPWRLTPLLDRDDPDGRTGMLLAPGAYFVLSLMLSFIVAALLSTPETVSRNGSFIGPGLAVTVQSAASDGDIWKIIASIMPIYGNAVFVGLLAMLLKPWAHQDWTLRVSIRAAFYVIATLTSWMIIVSALMDLARLSTGINEFSSIFYAALLIPTCTAIVWIYYWFFRLNGSVSWIKNLSLSLAMFGLIVGLYWVVDFLIRLLFS